MILLTGPFDVECGYGHKAREIAMSILNNTTDEVYIGFTPWGANPRTALENPR